MYSSRAFSALLVLSLVPSIVFSAPVRPNLAQRQDTTLAGFTLLGPGSQCFDFQLNGSKFAAQCVSVNGSPEHSSIDLNNCISNDNGKMVFRAKGNAFSSCNKCKLDGKTLDVTCKNCKNIAKGSSESTINIDGTKKANGNGVFVRDNGRLSCRAPI